jgi:hypothetical protein
MNTKELKHGIMLIKLKKFNDNRSFFDISLLRPIAAYFDIPSDALDIVKEYHCIWYNEIPPKVKQILFDTIIELFNGKLRYNGSILEVTNV